MEILTHTVLDYCGLRVTYMRSSTFPACVTVLRMRVELSVQVFMYARLDLSP